MGKYVPTKPGRRRSVSEALTEAEEEHYLDCPNAEPWIRAAATFLDAIFIFLMMSAVRRVYATVVHSPLVGPLTHLNGNTLSLISVGEVVIQGILLYCYCLWPVHYFGGSAGKLLLGLRIVNSTTGQRLTIVQTVVREVFGKFFMGALTLGFGLIMPLLRFDHLSLQDLISQSVVKKIHQRP